jgi:O-acetyl-ADP-ribose deacetylase (regulator of RNase III)
LGGRVRGRQRDARTVAFLGISTEIYRWPLEPAAEIALTTVAEADPGPIEEVVFALRGEAAVAAFRSRHNSLA